LKPIQQAWLVVALACFGACSDDSEGGPGSGGNSGASGSTSTDAAGGSAGASGAAGRSGSGGSVGTDSDASAGSGGTVDAEAGSSGTAGAGRDGGDAETDFGCSTTACGNATLDPGEECDLGVRNSDKGKCTKACKNWRCGDGLRYAIYEACDDGALNDTGEGHCTTNCTQVQKCGDGIIQGTENSDAGVSVCSSNCDSNGCPIYVDIDAAPGGNGESWATALDHFPPSAATSRNVWVAAGVYTGCPPAAHTYVIYGGFAGTEGNLSQRNWTTHRTVIRNCSVHRVDGIHLEGGMLEQIVANATLRGSTTLRGSPTTILRNVAVEGGLHQTVMGVAPNLEDVTLVGATLRVAVGAHLTAQRLHVMDGSSVVVEGGTRVSDTNGVKISDSNFERNVTGLEVRHHAPHEIQDIPKGTPQHLENVEFDSNETAVLWEDNTGPVVRDCAFTRNATGMQFGLIPSSAIQGGPRSSIERTRFENNDLGVGFGEYEKTYPFHDVAFLRNKTAVAPSPFSTARFTQTLFAYNDLVVISRNSSDGAKVTLPVHFTNCAFHSNGVLIKRSHPNEGFPVHLFFGSCSFYSSASVMTSPVDVVIPYPPTLHFTNSVFWPSGPTDPVSVPPSITSSCFAGASTSGNVALTSNPFVETDVDCDGVPELRLNQSSPCVNAGDNAAADASKIPWSTMTTAASGCLDVTPVDMGAHYPTHLPAPAPACQ
jgi:hypothetical protein